MGGFYHGSFVLVQLVGKRVRIRYVVREEGRHRRAPGGRGGSQASRFKRLFDQGNRHRHRHHGGLHLLRSLPTHDEKERLRPRPGGIKRLRLYIKICCFELGTVPVEQKQ